MTQIPDKPDRTPHGGANSNGSPERAARYPLIVRHCPQWDETRERFTAWWENRPPQGLSRRPIIRLRGRTETAAARPTTDDPYAHHADPTLAHARMEYELLSTIYLAEAFPNTNINLGAGSLALYLGSEPNFRMETVWFEEAIEDWADVERLTIDPENRWWKLHLKLIEEQLELCGGNYIINIPDLVENIDILSAMRGPQAFCLDIIDGPDAVKEQNQAVQDAWEVAYDAFYERSQEVDGSSTFTAFQIWGPGKTAKVQCDFNAMIGPDQFREFVQPQLRRQCDWLDYSVFHLDGPDALRHSDALMEIESLNCLQWTPGDGNPDCGDERWFPLYDTVRKAGKGLHLGISQGSPDEIWRKADALVSRYGPDGLYFLLPDMPENTARAWMERAEQKWG